MRAIRVARRPRPCYGRGMSDQKTLNPRAWADLLLLSLLWGASFLSIRVALDELGVMWVVAHRVGWAALILWGYVLLRRLPVPRAPAIWGAFAVMGLLNNVIPFGLMAWGQLHIETGLTSILNAATAVFAVLVAATLFRDERLTTRRLAGVSLGFAGVVIIIGPAALLSLDLRSLGQIAVLGGAMSYALAASWARVALAGLRPEMAAAGMLAASAAIMVPLAWAVEGAPDPDLSSRSWAAIGYYAVFSTALAYLLYYRVLAAAGAGNAALVTLLIPPVAITLGAVVLGEALPPRAFAGFAVLAAGLIVLNGRRPLPLSMRRRGG